VNLGKKVNPKLKIAVVVLIATLISQLSLAENDNHSYLLLKDVIVVSAHQGEEPKPVPEPTDILIQNSTILAIGKDLKQPIDGAVEVIEAADQFLIPGLIDGHTHLNEVPGMTFDHEQQFPEVSRQARYQIPRSYLYHGFTTLVDLNSEPDTIDAWNKQKLRPEAFFCGASPVFDGYPMSFMPKPLRYQIMPYFLFDESRANSFPEGFDPVRHTPQAVVKRIKQDGGICVKTHFEKGFGGRGDLPVPELDLIQQLSKQAEQLNMPVLLHANSELSQGFGVKSGVSAFAHGMWTWNDHSATSLSASTSTNIVEIIDTTIENNIALQPTIQVLYGEQDIHDPNYLNDPRLKNVLPESLIEWYATEAGQWWKTRMLNIPIVAQILKEDRWQELNEPPIKRVSAVLHYFASNGGRLLFGSDTPSDPTFANPPGLNGRLEMDRWSAAGVSLQQLFAALTINNARFYGMEDRLGSVEVGKYANLLLLRENPLEKISAYDSIETVILKGKVIERSSLSADAKVH